MFSGHALSVASHNLVVFRDLKKSFDFAVCTFDSLKNTEFK